MEEGSFLKGMTVNTGYPARARKRVGRARFVKDYSVHTFPELMPGISGLSCSGRDPCERVRRRGGLAYGFRDPVAVLLFFVHVQLEKRQVVGCELLILLQTWIEIPKLRRRRGFDS